MKRILMFIGFIIMITGGFLLGLARCALAHDPCSTYQPPTCGYVQVVNIDGELVQEYRCK